MIESRASRRWLLAFVCFAATLTPSIASAEDVPRTSVLIVSDQHAAAPVVHTTSLEPLRIEARTRTPPSTDPEIRIRGGLQLPSAGASLAGGIGAGGIGALGVGMGFHLGAQIDRVGIYASGRAETLLTMGMFQARSFSTTNSPIGFASARASAHS